MREAIRDWPNVPSEEDFNQYIRVMDKRFVAVNDRIDDVCENLERLDQGQSEAADIVSDLETNLSRLESEIKRLWKDPGTVGNGE